MFTTIFGFIFLSPMMAKKSSAATTFSFLISCHKSLALSLPVCFLYCFLKGFLTDKTHSPKGKLYMFLKGCRWFQVNK